MKTCVSIDCLFIGFCNQYNCGVDRSDGCKAQDWIIHQVEKHKEREKKKLRTVKKHEP